MRVAIVHDFLFKLGGAERVLKEIAGLYPKAPIYTLIYDEEKCGEVFPKERVVASKLKRFPKFLQKRPQYLLNQMPEAIEAFDFSEFDLVISSSGAFSHGIITGPKTKHLCYCHSPMRYAWDYTHEYLQEKKLSWWKEWLVRRSLHRLRQWDKTSSDRPDKYLANSRHVAKRLKKYFQVDADVLYPPVDLNRFYPYERSGDFFLIVSALTSFKKIELAVSAFNKMGKTLVIIGDGNQRKKLQAFAGSNISFLGRKSDDEVQQYLQSTRALIFPGEEDFGITPVEAMACGKPVIAYKKGGVTESVIDGITGILFDKPTVASLEQAVADYYRLSETFAPDIIRRRAEEYDQKKFRVGLKKSIDMVMHQHPKI